MGAALAEVTPAVSSPAASVADAAMAIDLRPILIVMVKRSSHGTGRAHG